MFGRSRLHIDPQTSYHHCNFDAFARTNVSTAVTVTFRTFHITICPLVTAFVNKAQINTTENIFHFQVKRILHNSRRTATRIFVLESDTVLIPALPPSVTFAILRPRRHVYWFISRTQGHLTVQSDFGKSGHSVVATVICWLLRVQVADMRTFGR